MLAVSAFTTFYDPLPDLPVGIDVAALVLPNLGLGLLVRHYWSAAVPLVVAVPYALAGDDGSNAFSYRLPALAIGVLAASAAVLVLTGVLLRTGRLHPPAWVGAAVLLLGAVPLLWAGYRQVRPLDETGDHPVGLFLFRLSARSHEGRTPAGRALVIRMLGPPSRSGSDSIAPLGDDFDEIGGPPFIATPGSTHETMRYRHQSFLVSDGGRVYGWVITDPEAETREGVGVGDNLDVAEERYDLDCGIARTGKYRTFPYCTGKEGAGWIWFGQDPIRSIVVTQTELGPG